MFEGTGPWLHKDGKIVPSSVALLPDDIVAIKGGPAYPWLMSRIEGCPEHGLVAVNRGDTGKISMMGTVRRVGEHWNVVEWLVHPAMLQS